MHDAKGRPLSVGDIVIIRAIVKELAPQEEYCNVTVETVLGRRPDGAKEKIVALNTAVLLRANPVDDNS